MYLKKIKLHAKHADHVCTIKHDRFFLLELCHCMIQWAAATGMSQSSSKQLKCTSTEFCIASLILSVLKP